MPDATTEAEGGRLRRENADLRAEVERQRRTIAALVNQLCAGQGTDRGGVIVLPPMPAHGPGRA